MKKKFSFKNIVFVVIILVLIIPQTREPIQLVLHGVLAKFSPSISSDKSDDNKVTTRNWELKTLNDKGFNLNETNGKVAIVNIWATWCPPCIAEFQSIQDLYNDYGDKVEFVLISNEKPDVINTFLKKHNYTTPIYIPLDKASYNTFNVRSIPRTFLIDKANNIVIDKSGAANWNSSTVRQAIDTLLK